MHNGKHALEGAKELIQSLVQQKKKLIILSNTSSPSHTTLQRLNDKNGLGFNSHDFITAITSGEEAVKYIKQKYKYDYEDNTNNNSNDDGDDNDSNNNRKKQKQKRRFIWFTWDYPKNENVPNPMDFLHSLNQGSNDDTNNDHDDDDNDDPNGVEFEPTLNIDDADFIVAHGSGVIRSRSKSRSMGNFLNDGNFDCIDEILQQCASRNLPMICANPDLIVKYHDGTTKNMPGQLAQRYIHKFQMTEEGKETIIFGKPNKSHFEACIQEIYHQQHKEEQEEEGRDHQRGDQQQQQPPLPLRQQQQQQHHIPKQLRIAHVGDSLHHDVAGANSAGIDSIFIMGGIHSDELLFNDDDNDDNDNDHDSNEDDNDTDSHETQHPTTTNGNKRRRQRLEDFFKKEGHTPTHVVPMFRL